MQCKNITKRRALARTGRITERKQHEMGRDRARRSPKKIGKFHHSPKWPPEANNGQAGVGFPVNKKWKDNITRVSSGNSRVA